LSNFPFLFLGNYGIPVPPDSRRFGGSSILNNSSMPASRNNSISGQINSFSGIHPPVPTGKQNAGVRKTFLNINELN